MPSLTEDMYCSEQICIPPSFPYLLRQYAKAAIRSQPTDLLKWSTAYFRCLSLNVPPPVKPRLEYPIPRDYNGITPGWLKTLLYQLQNNQTVPFKILWDRWIGACLQHHTLIQLLCLGCFEDAQAIPFLKFVAICTGTLTEDLTHTMILICEILTEEPEGGSAMIPLETFLDLYTFLARIDASSGQTLRNYYFRDSLLSLWREKVEKEEVKEVEREESLMEAEESIATKTSSETVEEGEKADDIDRVVSCPSLPEDDHYSIEYLLKQEEEIEEHDAEGEEGEAFEGGDHLEEGDFKDVASMDDRGSKKDADVEEEGSKKDEGDKSFGGEGEEGEEAEDAKSAAEIKTQEDVGDEAKKDEPIGETIVEVTEGPKEESAPLQSDDEQPVKQYESVDTITEQPVRDVEHVFEDDATLQEDLERLRALQQELVGETDDEVEKFKCRLIEEMPLTESQEEGVKHFGLTAEIEDHPVLSEEKLKEVIGEDVKSGDISSESRDDVLEEKDKRPYEDIYVEGIRGIGPMVSDTLIKAVVTYMKNCAKQQHGMVMPRNIRHYSCPPLEVLDY